MAALSAAETQAQNAVFDLVWRGDAQVMGDENISLDYKWYEQGADIDSSNKLVITSADKNISRIEFEGVYNGQRKLGPVLVGEGGGTLDFQPMATSVWQGSAKVVSFVGQSDTDYVISTLRIWFGMDACEPPVISGIPGRISFTHNLPDAVIHYTIVPNPGKSSGISNTGQVALCDFRVTAKAEAEGYAPSAEASGTVTFASTKTKKGDADGNNVVNLDDLTTLIQNILSRK